MNDSIDAIMRPRYVVVWTEDLSDDGKATLGHVDKELDLVGLGAYEGWPAIPSGADLYDYSAVSEGPRFTGCWQTFSPKLECSIQHKGGKVKDERKKLQLCIEKNVDSGCYASTRWCDAVARWQKDLPRREKGFGIIPYSEFVSVYLATSKV